MAKSKVNTVFFCTECGYESSKWMGQCPACKAWNTFAEETIQKGSGKSGGYARQESLNKSNPVSISQIEMGEDERIKTRIDEFDRVLGGGIVGGSLVLIGGDPGIGKSTLLLQVCQNLSNDHRRVLYISGEESLKQIKMRAIRLGEFSDSLMLLCETNLAMIEENIKTSNPEVVVIDSIQTMYEENTALSCDMSPKREQ